MPIVSQEVIELKSNSRRVRYQFTDHLGRIFNRIEKDIDAGLDVDADILSFVSQMEDELVGMEIQEALSRAENGQNPDTAPEHQTQIEFDRRLLGQLMLKTSSDVLATAYPFFTAQEARNGNNNNARAATLGVTTTQYGQLDARFGDMAGAVGTINNVNAQTWVELPGVFE